MTMDQVRVAAPAHSQSSGRNFLLGLVADAPPELDELDAQRPALSRTCCLAAIVFCVASWGAMFVGVTALLH